MKYKLFIEEGDYKDLSTGDRRNLMKVNWADTPDGPNVGWDDFDTDDSAFAAYNIEYDPIIQDVSIIEEVEPTVEELQAQLAALQADKDTLQKHVNTLIIENSNQITP